MDKNPLVSVCLLTYNQEPYIARAIEGILAQKTDFEFELVIGEDGSIDGTAEICGEFSGRFPDKIRLFCRSRADVIFVDGCPTARNNFIRTLRACRGRYIAYCEGDDYWQDEKKLQKQVDFLRSHPEYGMVHTVADVYYQSKNRLKKYKGGYQPPEGDIYDALFYRMSIFSSSTCCRADLVGEGVAEIAENGSRWMSADIALWLVIAFRSQVHYMDEATIVYRILRGSASRPGGMLRIIKFRRSLCRVYCHFLKKYGGKVSVPWLFKQCLGHCVADITKSWEQACARFLRRLLSLCCKILPRQG